MTKITFNKTNDNFFREVKEKIDDYFSSNKIKRTGNYKIYLKSILFLFATLFSYCMILFVSSAAWVSLLFCVFLGICFAAVGFNVMHDGGHGSFSSKKWLNELAGYSLNLMGGNIFIWKNKHNINHHTYTNIEGVDDDIDIEPWIRTHSNQKRYWFHRYQHIYGLLLYGLTYFNWIFVGDFKKYFLKKIGKTKMNEISVKEHMIFWISKALFFSFFLVIPIIKIGFWPTVLGYSIMSFVCGFILGIIFQLAHLTNEASFPIPSEDFNKIETNWFLHQIATTVNFATKNRAVSWFTGGLNYQVVHHLFPKISHVHYPKINELIRETCAKFNIKYNEYATFWGAVLSHVSYLKKLGTTA